MATAPDPRAYARAKARTAAPDPSRLMVVTVDGRRYEFDVDECSAFDIGVLRRETGMSLAKLMAALADDPDIDIVAAIVWLSRRQNGEPKIRYDLVVKELTYRAELDFGDNTVDPTAEADEADEHSPEG